MEPIVTITTIPMDLAYRHVPNEEIRDACLQGAGHLAIMTHTGRLRILTTCRNALHGFSADLSVSAGDLRERSNLYAAMVRAKHDPDQFLLRLRAFCLAWI